MFEAFWNVATPDDLRQYWLTVGSQEGFLGDEECAPFVCIETPRKMLDSFGFVRPDYLPSGMAPIGTNGGGEFIVFVEGKGFGLVPGLNDGAEDFLFVSQTLAGFLKRGQPKGWVER